MIQPDTMMKPCSAVVYTQALIDLVMTHDLSDLGDGSSQEIYKSRAVDVQHNEGILLVKFFVAVKVGDRLAKGQLALRFYKYTGFLSGKQLWSCAV